MEGNRHYKIAQEMTKRMETEKEPWKKMRGRRMGTKGWHFFTGVPHFHEDWEYEWIPETIMIGDREVRKPVSEPLTLGEDYYYADISRACVSCGVCNNFPVENARLKSGQIGRNVEHAQEICDAWLEVMRKATGVGHE